MKAHKDLIKTKEYWLTNFQEDLYAEIEAYMQENNLNRTQLAAQLGVTKGYISQVLNGNFDHRISKLIELVLAIGKVPKLEIMDMEDYLKKSNAPQLDEVEDSASWHDEVANIASRAGHRAVKEAHDNSVPVTYLEGTEIIIEDEHGQKTVLESTENNRRKVNIGEKSTLSAE